MNRSIPLVPVLLIAIASSCGGEKQPESQSAAAPGASSPTGANPQAGQVQADMREISDYRLTMPAVERYHQAQRAVYNRVRANPSLADAAELESDFSSLDDFEHELSSIPLYQSALEEAGLETREFVLIAFSLFQAETGIAAIDQGVSRDSVLKESDIHPDNLEFARQNRARLRQLQAETSAMDPSSADGD